MLPFVVVGGCIVVLMLILVVLGNSTGTADVMRHHLMYPHSQWSTLCPVDCTSKTLSWRLLLRLLTNIIIVIVGKSLPVQIIL